MTHSNLTNPDHTPEYALILKKTDAPDVPPFTLDDTTLCSRWTIAINPIYTIRKKGNTLRLKRKRAAPTWELEALMMLKVLPVEWTLDADTLAALRSKTMTDDIRRLLHIGVLLEVPVAFCDAGF
jgi:hypothetical protein